MTTIMMMMMTRGGSQGREGEGGDTVCTCSVRRGGNGVAGGRGRGEGRQQAAKGGKEEQESGRRTITVRYMTV